MRIEIKAPWEMPELRDCAALIEWMRKRLGRHPLARRRIFPLALHEDSSRAIVEAEEGEEFYAVVDFYPVKAGRKVEKTSVVMLPDRASVQRLIDDTHADYRKQNQQVATAQRGERACDIGRRDSAQAGLVIRRNGSPAFPM